MGKSVGKKMGIHWWSDLSNFANSVVFTTWWPFHWQPCPPFCLTDNCTCIVTYRRYYPWSHPSNLPNCLPMIASLLETYQSQWSSIGPVPQYRSRVYRFAAYQVLSLGFQVTPHSFSSQGSDASRCAWSIVHWITFLSIWFCSKTMSMWIMQC